MSKATERALLSRGFDSELTKALCSSGWTLQKLKQADEKALLSLGVRQDLVAALRAEPRPPIPADILLRVLYKSRRTCCICRDSSRPIVVHHIEEWSVSRSHEESNLVVLCLEHHDLAHTRKHLSQGLGANELASAKGSWERDIAILDAKTILRLKDSNDFARWDWINHQRVLTDAIKRNLKPTHKPNAAFLKQMHILADDGILLPETDWITENRPRGWFLDFGDGFRIAHYLSDITDQLIRSLPVIDITHYKTSPLHLKSILSPGDVIAVQAGFYFKSEANESDKRNEVRRAYYRGNGVRITYTFQAWYCLSSSARYDAMTGHKVQTTVGVVRSIDTVEGELVVSISCLAAGTAFAAHDNA